MSEQPINLRSSLEFNDPYFKINREERNVAALFYHLLLEGNNLKEFLISSGYKIPDKDSDFLVYFEYAFIRDLWKNIEKDRTTLEANRKKLEFITDFLKVHFDITLPFCDLKNAVDIKIFNSKFCTNGASSEKYIVSPSNWNVEILHRNFNEKDKDFRNLCKFKWCFNAKPDIVIHTSIDTAICIEAKWESNEGTYPANGNEKKYFNKKYIGQLAIQKMLMEEILGFKKVEFLFLTKTGMELKENEETKELSWNDAFKKLKKTNSHPSVISWVSQTEKLSQTEIEKRLK